jgi:hypothetical protein
MPSDGKSSHCLGQGQGELIKMEIFYATANLSFIWLPGPIFSETP